MASSSSLCLLVLVLLAVPCVFATDYTVGDASGWSQAVDYTTWASGKNFIVGDKLVFNYDGTHKVDIVNANDYSSCSSSNALKSYSDGKTTISLDTAGKMYFICPTAGHCSSGMKLSVDVKAAGSTPATPTTPTSPSSTPPSSTTPTTTSSPPPPSSSGAIGGFGSIKELMGSLVVSLLILAFMC